MTKLSDTDEIRVGVIGFGYVAKTFHVPLLRATPGYRVTAVASQRAAELAVALPGVDVVADPMALASHPDVDLVVIASPNDSHARLAEAALLAGRHVVVDKPFTVTLAEARRVAAVAEANRTIVSVFHNRRWDSDFLTVQREPHLARQGYLPTFSPAEEGQIHDTSLYLALALIAACWFAGFRRRAARFKYGFSVLPLRFEVARLVLASAAIAAFSFIMVIYAGIPWSVILVIALALIFTFVANNTTFGRHLYAIGGNPDAARLSGINVPRKTFMLFLIMGVMTAIAGVVYTARLNAATTSAGQNAELDAIAAAVIGGTSLMGGEGTIAGAVIGALVMASLDNGMSLMNLDITFQYVIKGLILLFAVWVDMAQRKKS
jgi:hypothetical protein